jgi:hypothetical protein
MEKMAQKYHRNIWQIEYPLALDTGGHCVRKFFKKKLNL